MKVHKGMNDWTHSFVQIGDDKMEGLYVSKLVRSFCRSSSSEAKGSVLNAELRDSWRLGAILCGYVCEMCS